MPGDAFDASPQELVVTLLGSYVHPRETRRVWSGGLVAVLAELGFSDGAARIALTRLVRRGLLQRHREGRTVHYSLTRRTIALLADGDQRIFSLGRRERAAGEWTVLWQSIPESRRQARERLVRRLRFLGFGPYQDGTWIAPHDREAEVVALLGELDVTEHAGLLLGRPSAALDVRRFAGRAWDLDDLAARYTAFVAQFGGYAGEGDPGRRTRSRCTRAWCTPSGRSRRSTRNCPPTWCPHRIGERPRSSCSTICTPRWLRPLSAISTR